MHAQVLLGKTCLKIVTYDVIMTSKKKKKKQKNA